MSPNSIPLHSLIPITLASAVLGSAASYYLFSSSASAQKPSKINLLDFDHSSNDNNNTNDNNIPYPLQIGSLPPVRSGIDQLIGNTPMVEVKSLSKATGCRVLAKLELANPGGSAKDRVALAIIQDAEKRGLVKPGTGDAIFEGTSGSTGISIAMLCRARGYEAHIALPDDTSAEKIQLLESYGAVVYKVPPASIVDENQYVNYAKKKAAEINNLADTLEEAHNKKTAMGISDPDYVRPKRAFFADQFENEANWITHFENTGPEIWAQTKGEIDLFVTSAGTGGTIAGVSIFLKSAFKKTLAAHQHTNDTKSQPLRVVLADPQGSGFYNKVKYGVMFSLTEREGTRRRHQVDTLVEGVGLNRITANFEAGEKYIDDAVKVTDNEALKMAKWLSENDGLFLGSSSAINAVAAYKCAKALGPGHTIVTIFCDSGSRHLSKFWKEARALESTFESLAELD